MCTNWLMIEGTALTTFSTFPDIKPRDVVFQRPIISELFIESGFMYLTAGTSSAKMERKKKTKHTPPGPVLLYIHMHIKKNPNSFTHERRVMHLFKKKKKSH